MNALFQTFYIMAGGLIAEEVAEVFPGLVVYFVARLLDGEKMAGSVYFKLQEKIVEFRNL